LSADEPSIDDFIVLSRINRRSCIIIDSDKTTVTDDINKTKQRVAKEFIDAGLPVWITEGREIENYLDPDYYTVTIQSLYPDYRTPPSGQFDDLCKLEPEAPGKNRSVDKVKLAHEVAANFEKVVFRFDWATKIKNLITFVTASK
jgi:hypothetical protein